MNPQDIKQRTQKRSLASGVRKNSIELLPDGVILIRYYGQMTKQAVDDVGNRTDFLIEQAQEQGKPVNILTDLTHVTGADLASQQAGRRWLATRHHDKVAILNIPTLYEIVAHLVIRLANQGDRVRDFKDEAKALAWLRQQNSAR